MKVWKFDRILLTVISNQNSQFQGSNKTVFCYCLCYIMIHSLWMNSYDSIIHYDSLWFNQLHCWMGGQWNIILKRHFRYHITIVYSKGYERRNPKLSQTTQEVASVRGSRLFTEFFFYYLHFDCTNELKTSVVWKRKTVGTQASKAHFSRKTRCVTRCYVSQGTVENLNAF